MPTIKQHTHLYLFVLFNNSDDEDIFSLTSGIVSVLEDISQFCQIQSKLSIEVVRCKFENLTKSYLKKSTSFSIMHDKIFDIMVSFYGEHMFDLVLQHSVPECIRDRFFFQSMDSSSNEYIILVPKRKEKQYFKRVYRDFKKNL